MKKYIILTVSVLLAVVCLFLANSYLGDLTLANGPKPDEKPLIMVNDKIYQSSSSCSSSAFTHIEQSQDFKLAEFVITSTVKSATVPTKNLSTNFKLFKKCEIYLSSQKEDEIYIKAIVKDEVRYYLFTPAEGISAV